MTLRLVKKDVSQLPAIQFEGTEASYLEIQKVLTENPFPQRYSVSLEDGNLKLWRDAGQEVAVLRPYSWLVMPLDSATADIEVHTESSFREFYTVAPVDGPPPSTEL